MELREQFRRQEEAWRRFHEWEASEPPMERDAARLIADLGAILDWLPRDARLLDPDPEKLGVQKLMKALASLRPSR